MYVRMHADQIRAKQRQAQQRFEGLKTVTIAHVVLAPIAIGMGLLMDDAVLVAGSLIFSVLFGVCQLYLVRKLEKTYTGR